MTALLLPFSTTAMSGEFAKKVKDVKEENIFWTQRKAQKQIKGSALSVSGSEFEIKPKAIKKLLKAKKDNISISVLLSGKKEKLLLVKQDPFKFETSGIHYAGIVKGDKDSLVSISIFDGKLTGSISTKGKEYSLDTSGPVVFVQDLEGQKNPIPDAESPVIPFDKADIAQAVTSAAVTGQKEVSIAFEMDYKGFLAFSQNTANIQTVFQSIFAQVAAIYANTGVVQVKAASFKVWSSQDPYDATDIGRLLYNFTDKNYLVKPAGVDAMHLLTVRGWGGIAYVDQLCKSIPFSVSSIYTTFPVSPVYSWPSYVVAHELGHTMGSKHTHACAWNGNNTAIDGCYNPEGTCARPVVPQGFKGTIMSYCHVSSAGIDFGQGFGPQPLAVIQKAVAAATCLKGASNVDTTKPTVTITNPVANASLSGSVSIDATASDNVGVTRVDFQANGVAIGSDTTSPYSASFNTSGIANGAITFKATAYDLAGNTESASVSANVQNQAAQTFAILSSVVGQNKTVADTTKRNWIDLTLVGLMGNPTFAAKLTTNTSWSAKTPLALGNNTFRVYVNSANTNYDASATCGACSPASTKQVSFKTLP